MSDDLHSSFRLDDGNKVDLHWNPWGACFEVFVWGYGYAGDARFGMRDKWRVEWFADRNRDFGREFDTETEAARFLAEWLVNHKNKLLEESQ